MNYLHIAQRVFNTPLAISENKLQVILQVLGPRFGVDVPLISADIANAQDLRKWPNKSTVPDGIAVIGIDGTLVNRYASAPSGASSYDWIRDSIRVSAADGSIAGIMLRIDSFGGEVSGLFDCLDVIREACDAKPVWCSIDDTAFSAAYAIASQTDRIYVTRTGGAGSVGVIAMHFDYSQWAKNEGIKPTPIFAGARKADLSPWQPINDEALAWITAEVRREYDRFVQYVAEGRAMDAAAVRNTEAGLYTGQDAIEIGFADVLGTFEQALQDLAAELDGSAAIQGGSSAISSTGAAMKKPSTAEDAKTNRRAKANKQNEEEPQEQKGGDPEPDDEEETESDEDEPKSTSAANTAATARQAERSRIGAILNCEEAQGREKLARTLALETDTTADVARKLLSAAPQEKSAVANPLAAAMANVPNPAVGGDVKANASDEQSLISSVLALSGQKKEAR